MPKFTTTASPPPLPRRVRTLPALRYRHVVPPVFRLSNAAAQTATPTTTTDDISTCPKPQQLHPTSPASPTQCDQSVVQACSMPRGDVLPAGSAPPFSGMENKARARHERAENHRLGRLLLRNLKDAEIEKLKKRIRHLEQSERRVKARLIQSKDETADKMAELGEVRRALNIAEESLSENKETMQQLIREVHHYQGWWLNEYYCLKVALKLARNQNDKGVKAMKESSHARFMKWSVSHQS